eukprot:8458135-Alexandrium_andersonii.AAC.1
MSVCGVAEVDRSQVLDWWAGRHREHFLASLLACRAFACARLADARSVGALSTHAHLRVWPVGRSLLQAV